MSKTKYLSADYFRHLFKRDWKEERFNYLLIEKRYRTIGYQGFLDTSIGVHEYHEFQTQADLNHYMKNNIAPADRKDWAVYMRYKSLEVNS